MNDQQSTFDHWDTCSPGELQKLATRLRWRRRDRKVAKALRLGGTLVVLLLVSGLAAQPFRGRPDGPHPLDGVTCAEVQANVKQYAAGQLAPQLAERIRIHLQQCPECGPAFRRMMAEMKQELSSWFAPGSEPACTCDRCQQPALADEPRLVPDRSSAVLVAMQVPR